MFIWLADVGGLPLRDFASPSDLFGEIVPENSGSIEASFRHICMRWVARSKDRCRDREMDTES